MAKSTRSPSNYRTFKRAIIITVTLLNVFIVSLFIWKSISEYRLTIHGAEAKGKAYTRALKEHAERAFGESDSILLNFVEKTKSTVDITREHPENLKARLKESAGDSPQIGSLLLVNREGVLFAHSLEANLKQADVSDRDYFIHHRENPAAGRPFISRPIKSRINGKWRFTISRAILDRNGHFSGLVAAAMEMDYFRRFYGSLDLGRNGKIVMLRRDGQFLMAEPFAEKDFSIDFSKSNVIRTHIPRSSKGIFHIPGGKALIGTDGRIIAYEALENFPVIAMANQSMDEVIAPWKERTLKQGGLIFLAVGALVFLASALIRQIRKIEQGYARELGQQQEIAEAAATWQNTFDSVEDAIWVMDTDRRILRCNQATVKIFGKDDAQVINHLCCEITHHGQTPVENCPFNVMAETRQRASMELNIDSNWYKISVDPIVADNGNLVGAVHIVSDITQMKAAEHEKEILEQKLSQAQKMEAIGHLAGGIAHDFNNLLTPIMGYAEMALSDIPQSDPLAKKLAGILSASHKAKALTLQLLSFSRRKSASSEKQDLNEIIISINDILRRTIRESIRIELCLDPEESTIEGDRTQIEQVLINLMVNSQDALGEKQGKIRLETCRVWMEGENVRLYPGMVKGEYVLLSFSDNGCGIPHEVMDHIFEPFFTTKPAGHGTGLGLATVYGIVKQLNAFIGVTSRLNEGTTFNIYFPAASSSRETSVHEHQETDGKRLGDGTVLLVEDNQMAKEMVEEMLSKMGYAVSAYSDPQLALNRMEKDLTAIDLLISDIVMPGMNGTELYEKLLVLQPELKVIFISGYPVNPAHRGGTLEDEINYLQKPFTAEALMERIRQVM